MVSGKKIRGLLMIVAVMTSVAATVSLRASEKQENGITVTEGAKAPNEQLKIAYDAATDFKNNSALFKKIIDGYYSPLATKLLVAGASFLTALVSFAIVDTCESQHLWTWCTRGCKNIRRFSRKYLSRKKATLKDEVQPEVKKEKVGLKTGFGGTRSR
jgi:hypothetical protein